MPKTESFELILVLFILLGCVARAEPAPTLMPRREARLEGAFSLHSVSGGPVVQGVSDSRPLAKMTFEVRQDNRTVASFTTDDQGRFGINLPPGHYTVSRKDWKSRVGFYGPFPIELANGETRKVAWNCETGRQ